jgi:hypothetical protein
MVSACACTPVNMTTAHTKANSIFNALFMDLFLSVLLVSDVALIITFSLDLHDIIGFPRLVEELDVGSVKADDRNGNENCFFWIVEIFLFSQRYDNFV